MDTMDHDIVELDLEEEAARLVNVGDQSKPDFVNLQMVMVTSSMNHEYTRKAYDLTRSYQKRQELSARMSQLKNLYYVARRRLAASHPDRLEAIERELVHQKQTVLSDSEIH